RALEDACYLRRTQSLRPGAAEAIGPGVLSDRARGGEGRPVKAENPVLSQLHKARVLVVGDVMLDRYWFGEVSRISPEAPVPIVKIESKRTKETPGGAANLAANAAALGANVALLSVVGDDEPGRMLAQLLAERHVQANLHRDGSIDTTVKLRVIGGRHQQMLRVDFETPPS